MVQADQILEVGEPRHDEAGLTLPEVIAALVILALSLGALFPLLSDGLRRTSQAEAMAEAGSLAQSLLSRVGTELAMRPGITTGEFPRSYRWRLQIEPYGDADDQRAWPVAAYTVTAEIAWGGRSEERSISLATLRLAPKEAGR